MNFNYKNKKKIISGILIVSILAPIIFFSMPKKTRAFPVEEVGPVAGFAATTATNTGVTAGATTGTNVIKGKEWVFHLLQQVLKAAAQRALLKMTQSTVNWINSGFHGKPLFLERPKSFFKDIAKSEIRQLVNTIGYDSNRFPFGKSTALGIINSYKSTFEQNAQYSLSRVTNDPALLESFRNDFSVGGWDGFLLTTQFPQNNPIGFQMLVAEEQARVLAGTGQSRANEYRDLLQQGQGFLSPQVCLDNGGNNAYNNNNSPFKRPNFKCTVPETQPRDCSIYDPETAPPPRSGSPSTGGMTVALCQKLNDLDKFAYEQKCQKQRADWEEKNVCKSGLVNTTPGSVVASQIMKSLNVPTDQATLAGAMGNSLSAIFDALLNKLASSGLNALSNKLNGSGRSNNDDDNFNYYGNTLGVDPGNNGNTGGGFNWNGPDQVIVLGTFKRDVQNAITNGNKELRLIDSGTLNANTSDLARFANVPGILQTFENIWPKTAELDMCLPGPNIGWENRLDEDTRQNGSSFTTEPFKNWLINKMRLELPGSVSYLSAVNSIKNINNQVDELKTRASVITETLIKLESINSELGPVRVEPESGSLGEDTLIRLKQRYDSMQIDLSTPGTVADAQNKLADAKDKVTSLSTLFAKCTAERTTKGWSNPGGESSTLNNSNSTGSNFWSGGSTEKQIFCGSYSGANINCDAVFKTDIGDYKIL